MKYFHFLWLAPFLFACNAFKEDPGALMTEYRDIDTNYTSVSIDGDIKLIVVQDDSFTLKVEAGENHLPYIRTRVFNDYLEIYEESNRIKNNTSVRVFISKSFLNDITLDGSGSVDAINLIATHPDVTLNGSGDIDLQYAALTGLDLLIDGSGNARVSGAANAFNARVSGSGDIDARYLPVVTSTVNITGSGNVRVNASAYLNVNIEGSGDVLYWGNPDDLDVDISGSGQVIDME